MNEEKPTAYAYIPNSVPALKEQMLKELAAESVEEFCQLFAETLRLKEKMNLPKPHLTR